MKSKRVLLITNLVLKMLVILSIFLGPTAIASRTDGPRESDPLIRFLRAVDPDNALRFGHLARDRNPCLEKWIGVKCDSILNSIVEIRLDNSNLGGIFDSESLCRLPNLQVISLAGNRIRGNIPGTLVKCRKLVYLNLSNNCLSGVAPEAMMRLRFIRNSDISNNNFEGSISRSLQDSTDQANSSTGGHNSRNWIILALVVFGIGFVLFIAFLLGKKLANLKSPEDSPAKTPLAKAQEEVGNKPKSQSSELVFFVGEEERFSLEDLLEATADLRSHSLCSTLFKVGLKNGEVYAVKSLKKLQILFGEFGEIMREIGALKHENILPLVAYSSTPEDKLLIYKYQNKGSLLNLLEDYMEGKREFHWGLRLSIAGGIAKGLNFIHESQKSVIPHGNIKPSNILLDENEEPLICDFGLSKFLDRDDGIGPSKGYTAPEKALTEKSDVFSFGVILLELLTGKSVEKTGVDLPKWVNAVVREEWTGEVFDKRLAKSTTQWAFPLLNVALKCVTFVPENRPTFSEVLERIEEVVGAEEDHDMSAVSSSANECPQNCCHLHSIISEAWDTPGSNY